MLIHIHSRFLALFERTQLGFTLLELLIGIAILSALTLIAVPSYQGYVERAQVAQAIGDIREMEIVIARFLSDNNSQFPESLADVGKNGLLDPWGRPYVYTDLTTAKGKGKARKDKKFNPINSTYDLYSLGKDGVTKSQLDNKDSLDDVVRANDGRYIGLAAKYNN